MIRRFAAALLITAGIIATAAFAFGDGLVCDEAVSALPASNYEIEVIDAGAHRAKLVFGDLHDQCVPKPVVMAVAYTVQWGKQGDRRAVGVPSEMTAIKFPAEGYRLERQAVRERATVALRNVTVVTAQGKSQKSLVFELVLTDGVWHVIAVSVK